MMIYYMTAFLLKENFHSIYSLYMVLCNLKTFSSKPILYRMLGD